MNKFIVAFLIISAGFLSACKPVLILDNGLQNSGDQNGHADLGLSLSQSGQFLAARQALYNQDSATAGLYFDRALLRDARNLMLLEQSFLSHYQSGNLARAAAVAVELEQLGSALSLSAEPALSNAVRSSDWQAVIALSDKIGQTDNGYILATGLRSLAFIGLGEPETALQEQQRLLDFITDAKIDIPLEILTLQQAYLAEITGNITEAVAFYESVSLRDDQASYVVLAATAGLWRLGEHEAAHAILAKYQGDDLGNSRLSHLFTTGQTRLIDQFDLRQFIARFIFEFNWFGRLPDGQALVLPRLHLALSVWPHLDPGHLALAQIYFDRPNYDRADYHLEQIDSNSPYFNQAVMLKMQIAHQTGTADAAFDLAQEALTQLSVSRSETMIAHEKALIFQYAGSIARQNELYIQAIRYFEESIALGRNTSFNYRNLGISYARSGQVEQAEAALLTALALNPDDALTLNYLGYWWVDENRRIEDALDLIRKAVKLRPTSGYFADSLGWAYFRQNNFDEAVFWLEKAIQLTPADPVIADHLGDAYWKTGRLLEARYKWQQALDMGIEDTYIGIIVKKMTDGLD